MKAPANRRNSAPDRRSAPRKLGPGLQSRTVALDVLDRMRRDGVGLDAALDEPALQQRFQRLELRDRAFVRNLLATTLRHRGEIEAVIGALVHRPLPKSSGRTVPILHLGLAQLLFLGVADHAAVDSSVALTKAHPASAGFRGLVNGVLRRAAREREELLAAIDAPVANTPAWLMARWTRTYGAETARAIAAAHGIEPALDVTVRSDPDGWAERLGGRVLPTGTVRTLEGGPIPERPGYAEGAWWVQDAAAAIPARLLGDVAGLRVADLCAAPGGKTAQLAAAGADVTAVDVSAARLARLSENLDRLGLAAHVVAADLLTWEPAEPFDAILLDAPCTSTGTIRRQPDVAWLKQEDDIRALADLQARLLARAVAWLKPGGCLVYSTCSLEPEEGEDQVARLLAADPRVAVDPIPAEWLPGLESAITLDGWLRTLPCHLPDPEPRLAGLDGFFAARLRVGS
ncbi:RsmB/NOP family class I SAM-dependent RNA methyltransferase [Amorphus orientalis]|uniref:16S rRNA (Cytosine967-C5)-methyltransferase n=1 Tax=Amorphus orientalis TaxID=649198 RepID=A0AAE3VMF6_9HYPH|nr:RsmB/NOP family class I SAM-dependent RNA methyltransferase [Amorphus orientalis]MDQ0314645.1 16S rRNA (cytosine967-C5)-methyltransferase [Amorphus orientalis]